MGAIPPSAILSRKGIARYGGVSRTGPLSSRVRKKGSFAKGVFSEKSIFLQIVENLEILNDLPAHLTFVPAAAGSILRFCVLVVVLTWGCSEATSKLMLFSGLAMSDSLSRACGM